MSKLLSLLLALLVVIALFVTTPVRCDEEVDVDSTEGSGSEGGATEEDHEEVTVDDVEESNNGFRALVPAPDVTTVVYFPNANDRKFTQGDEITVLVGLTNTGDKTYNLTYVGAALHSPYDYSYYIQNFTVYALDQTLHPNSEVTVEYRFQPDVNLEPLDFHLSGFIGYNGTDDEPFRSSWINGTVTLIERKSDVDARTLFTYVCVVSAIGLIAYIFVNVNNKGKKSVRGENGTRGSTSAASWEVHTYKPRSTSLAVGKKSSQKKSS